MRICAVASASKQKRTREYTQPISDEDAHQGNLKHAKQQKEDKEKKGKAIRKALLKHKGGLWRGLKEETV